MDGNASYSKYTTLVPPGPASRSGYKPLPVQYTYDKGPLSPMPDTDLGRVQDITKDVIRAEMFTHLHSRLTRPRSQALLRTKRHEKL